MERLIAWYRVGSTYGAVAALLIANTVPLLGVVFLGWNVWTILTIYWLENGVVGTFNVLKMAKVEDAAGAPGSGAVNTGGRRSPGRWRRRTDGSSYSTSRSSSVASRSRSAVLRWQP